MEKPPPFTAKYESVDERPFKLFHRDFDLVWWNGTSQNEYTINSDILLDIQILISCVRSGETLRLNYFKTPICIASENKRNRYQIFASLVDFCIAWYEKKNRNRNSKVLIEGGRRLI